MIHDFLVIGSFGRHQASRQPARPAMPTQINALDALVPLDAIGAHHVERVFAYFVFLHEF